jgi:hypothetical protein
MQDEGNDDCFPMPAMFGEGSSATYAEDVISFIETYRKSIAPVLSFLEHLIGRSVKAGHPIKTHPPATKLEMASMLAILKLLSSLAGDKLQINTSSSNTHPGI